MLEFMERLYEATGGRTLDVVSIDQLAAELGWSETDASAVVEYLNAEGLIEHQMGNQASITHDGVVEVEEALEPPAPVLRNRHSSPAQPPCWLLASVPAWI